MQQELAKCQRFYTAASGLIIFGTPASTTDVFRNFVIYLPVTMRSSPQITAIGSDVGALTPALATPGIIWFNHNYGETTNSHYLASYTASADL